MKYRTALGGHVECLFFFNLTLNIAYYLIAGVTKSLSKALWAGRVHHLPCLVYTTGCTTRKLCQFVM